MKWKNQLTKTPYLVLFIILISVGVGTASALISITLAGNVIITDDLTVDNDTLFVDSSANKVGVGNLSPDAALHVRGAGSDFTPNQEGIQLTGSDQSGNPGIELTANDGTPYIDFQNDTFGTDYDARIILEGNDKLEIKGANLECPNCILGFYKVFNGTSGTGGFLQITAQCDVEDQVTGGGYVTPSSGEPPYANNPFANFWGVNWLNSESGKSHFVYAICADYPPEHEP